MKPFRVHTGRVAPLHRANIDTDQIIPKQFLKRIERTGFGEFLFHEWRPGEAALPDGTPDLAFPLNHPRHAVPEPASWLRERISDAARPANTRCGHSTISVFAP